MRLLAVLENEQTLPVLSQMLKTLAPEAELMYFGNGLPALAAARRTEIDVALLDVSLPELSGLDFGSYLRELYPSINLIYLADGPESAYDALRQHASGYMLRPLTEEKLREELDDLRHPLSERRSKRLFAQTFGNFEELRQPQGRRRQL